jgi:hypothetical protein
MCVWVSQIQLQLGEIGVSFKGAVVERQGVGDVVVGCCTRSFRLEARRSPLRTGLSAAQQLRKALRCLSFDLYIQTNLLLGADSGMSEGSDRRVMQ